MVASIVLDERICNAMRALTLRSLLPVFLIACAAEPPPPPPAPAPPPVPPPVVVAPPPKPQPETLTVDSPRSTAGGTTFIVPAGWTVTVDGAHAVLSPPEPDLQLAVVETDAHSADEAVAKAWPVLEPGFKRPLHLSQPQNARHGWDERKGYDYETSPDEKLEVAARAIRKDATWVVLLVRGSQATIEKRVGTVTLVSESLAPKGYAKESFAGKTPHPLDAARVKEVTDFVEQARQALEVPGVAISLVADGKPVFEGGFGVRELGKPAKVDADTLFIIASNTKALTTLLLAKEIDEGKFTWDTPVTQVYPSFKLGDADTTKQVLMKHLVCACTGMPREDLPWLLEYAHASPKSELDLLGTFQPTSKFGEAFQYSNLMAAAAGFIGGHVAFPKEELGKAYDDALRTKLFEPLGMKATTFDFARAIAGNHASPHGFDVDGNRKIAGMAINRSVIPLRPAGGAWSSARDLTRYVQMELAKGKLPNGKPLLSEANLLARRAPQIAIGEHTTYGMALEVDTEWGVAFVHHGGDLIGYHSDMFWIPEAGVGGVIFTNADGGWNLRRPFIRKVLEVLYDGKPEAKDDVATAAASMKAEIAKARERLLVPAATDAVQKLAPHYRNDVLGDLTVVRQATATLFDFGEWKSSVASRKNDDGTVSMLTIDPGLDGFEFVIGDKDGKRVLVIRDAQHEYVFKEVP